MVFCMPAFASVLGVDGVDCVDLAAIDVCAKADSGIKEVVKEGCFGRRKQHCEQCKTSNQ